MCLCVCVYERETHSKSCEMGTCTVYVCAEHSPEAGEEVALILCQFVLSAVLLIVQWACRCLPSARPAGRLTGSQAQGLCGPGCCSSLLALLQQACIQDPVEQLPSINSHSVLKREAVQREILIAGMALICRAVGAGPGKFEY